jgi:hypothetical protein
LNADVCKDAAHAALSVFVHSVEDPDADAVARIVERYLSVSPPPSPRPLSFLVAHLCAYDQDFDNVCKYAQTLWYAEVLGFDRDICPVFPGRVPLRL